MGILNLEELITGKDYLFGKQLKPHSFIISFTDLKTDTYLEKLMDWLKDSFHFYIYPYA